MIDPEEKREQEETPARAPLPSGEEFFDPWEREFRRSYTHDDKTFDF
jgi:hypothetical protein